MTKQYTAVGRASDTGTDTVEVEMDTGAAEIVEVEMVTVDLETASPVQVQLEQQEQPVQVAAKKGSFTWRNVFIVVVLAVVLGVAVSVAVRAVRATAGQTTSGPQARGSPAPAVRAASGEEYPGWHFEYLGKNCRSSACPGGDNEPDLGTCYENAVELDCAACEEKCASLESCTAFECKTYFEGWSGPRCEIWDMDVPTYTEDKKRHWECQVKVVDAVSETTAPVSDGEGSSTEDCHFEYIGKNCRSESCPGGANEPDIGTCYEAAVKLDCEACAEKCASMDNCNAYECKTFFEGWSGPRCEIWDMDVPTYPDNTKKNWACQVKVCEAAATDAPSVAETIAPNAESEFQYLGKNCRSPTCPGGDNEPDLGSCYQEAVELDCEACAEKCASMDSCNAYECKTFFEGWSGPRCEIWDMDVPTWAENKKKHWECKVKIPI
jgi:hypothetical protein